MGAVFSRIGLLQRNKVSLVFKNINNHLLNLVTNQQKSSKEALEALESDLKLLVKTRDSSQQCERTVVTLLLVILLLTYPVILLVGVVIWLWFADTISNRLVVLYLSLVISLPVLLYGLKRVANVWFTRRKTQYNSAIQSVHDEKKKILSEVENTEPYKIAKELLEKYDPQNHQLSASREQQGTVRQRRPIPQSPHPALQHQTTPARVPHVPVSTPRPQPPPIQQQRSIPLGNGSGSVPLQSQGSFHTQPGHQFIPPGHCAGVVPGPPTPVPILPRDRTGMDRVMDFVLGDGPSNRYALVCSECHSHNGMALKDEFEYLSFRCAYCYVLNNAKKSRPSSASLGKPVQSNNDTESKDTAAVTNTAKEKESNNEKENVEAM